MIAKRDGECRCGHVFAAGDEITFDSNAYMTSSCPNCAGKASVGEQVQIKGNRGAVYDVTLTETATSTADRKSFAVSVGHCQLGTVSQVMAHSRGDRTHAAHDYAAWSSLDTAGKMGIQYGTRDASIRALIVANAKRIAREE